MIVPNIAVQLGRIGDILNILPACKHLGIGHMLINPQFDFVLKGQSYVRGIHWAGDMENLRLAVEFAHTISPDVRVPQLFGRIQPDGLPPRTRDSFVIDQWDRIKPSFGDMWGKLPLEFDQRDARRELELLRGLDLGQSKVKSDKPLLLVNLFSHSSPVAADYAQEIMTYLRERWSDFEIVDLSNVRAEAYCDLLAVYECATGIITADTATLHLCRACPNLPTFHFVRHDKDCTYVREFEATQDYSERGMGKIDAFIQALKGEIQ